MSRVDRSARTVVYLITVILVLLPVATLAGHSPYLLSAAGVQATANHSASSNGCHATERQAGQVDERAVAGSDHCGDRCDASCGMQPALVGPVALPVRPAFDFPVYVPTAIPDPLHPSLLRPPIPHG